jgi:hypothetical protein
MNPKGEVKRVNTIVKGRMSFGMSLQLVKCSIQAVFNDVRPIDPKKTCPPTLPGKSKMKQRPRTNEQVKPVTLCAVETTFEPMQTFFCLSRDCCRFYLLRLARLEEGIRKAAPEGEYTPETHSCIPTNQQAAVLTQTPSIGCPFGLWRIPEVQDDFHRFRRMEPNIRLHLCPSRDLREFAKKILAAAVPICFLPDAVE